MQRRMKKQAEVALLISNIIDFKKDNNKRQKSIIYC